MPTACWNVEGEVVVLTRSYSSCRVLLLECGCYLHVLDAKQNARSFDRERPPPFGGVSNVC